MSIALSSNEEDILSRIPDVSADDASTRTEDLDETYLLPECSEWIAAHDYKRIALQFPDRLLHDAAAVYQKLELFCSGRRFFILGDTTYCSCCVDEIAAEHANCDSVIHFGPSCLSPSSRLPVALVFPSPSNFDTEAFCHAAQAIIDSEHDVVLLYDTQYFASLDVLAKRLPKLKFSSLMVPKNQTVIRRKHNQDFTCDGSMTTLPVHSRRKLPESNDPVYLYLGQPNSLMTNLRIQLGQHRFYVYDFEAVSFILDPANLSKRVMRRYFLIEKFKDAQIVGILVGTLGVKDYLQIIERLKTIIKAAGKKYYTFVMGKPNPPKLANFMEIDIFVYVACPESYFDSKEFLKPVVTPHEVEIACGQRPFEERFIADFRDLLPGGKAYVELNDGSFNSEPDVSLITGSARVQHTESTENGDNSDAVVLRDSAMTLSTLPAAHNFLNERAWKGLEPRYGADAAGDIVEGTHGIAQSYAKDSEEKSHGKDNSKEKECVCPCSGGSTCSKVSL
ncbi:2-(3-amino-3-carboxypropyl)histidine synthase subunit 2-like [Paramacrobiotus metropolitanus]|uniref:2-(3-amino-3-carboxypropyl)histidine synthase subunit 2-like n=1 Tax=Paramacrobiotus metropolitanus TaxID=2943436 RepID=UPI002445EED6|nr:2-(3-amino-3-carboxypropyl)histidine synthase subunit 2-like [Paramacrobiotus metropolitanus]